MLILAAIILVLSGILVLAMSFPSIFLSNLVVGPVLLFAGVILLLMISLVIWLIFNKKIKINIKVLLLSPIFLVIALLLVRYTVYQGDLAKAPYNQVVIDRSIPSKDVEDIKKLAAGLIEHTGITIKYYDKCQPNLPTPRSQTEMNNGSNPSYKCQPGDMLLILSSGGSGGEKFDYFLLRKVDGAWKVIENLGSQSWIS